MNSHVQVKINEIKKLSARSKASNFVVDGMAKQKSDGLSMAIHSERDAETFITELNALRKAAK